MTDEQIAREFVQQIRYHCSNSVAVSALRRIMRQVRTTERARCAAIVTAYADDLQPGPVQIAAREMLAAIEEE